MSRLRDLIRNDRGAAAMMFGLAAVPITLAAGGALDFTRAGLERSQLQAKANSAALGAVLARTSPPPRNGATSPSSISAPPTSSHRHDGAHRHRGSHGFAGYEDHPAQHRRQEDAHHRRQGHRDPHHDRPAGLRHRAQQDMRRTRSSLAATRRSTRPTCGCTAIRIARPRSPSADRPCQRRGLLRRRRHQLPSNPSPTPTPAAMSWRIPMRRRTSSRQADLRPTTSRASPATTSTISPGVFCGGMDFKGTPEARPRNLRHQERPVDGEFGRTTSPATASCSS